MALSVELLRSDSAKRVHPRGSERFIRNGIDGRVESYAGMAVRVSKIVLSRLDTNISIDGSTLHLAHGGERCQYHQGIGAVGLERRTGPREK